MDTETQISKHLENETVARKLAYGCSYSVFMKNITGNLGGGDLNLGRMADIKVKGSAFRIGPVWKRVRIPPP
jgi:hypothetical protein